MDQQMFSMWNSMERKRFRRYLFIIDRRNPQNIEHKNMGFIEPKMGQSQKTWKDQIYFIVPNEYNELTVEIGLFPEQSLGLSTKYIFPNPDKREPDHVKILDALNGYKFALSYHLFSQNNCSVYWYLNQGSTRFYVQDMKWLWSRFFAEIENKPQTLSSQILQSIDYCNIYQRLSDDDFEEFMVQSQSQCQIQIPNIDSRTIPEVVTQLAQCFEDSRIAELFAYVVKEEQFEDLETIKDDIEEVEDSVILQYIIEQTESKINQSRKDTDILRQNIKDLVYSNKTPKTPQLRLGTVETYGVSNDEIQTCFVNALLPLRKSAKKLRPRNVSTDKGDCKQNE